MNQNTEIIIFSTIIIGISILLLILYIIPRKLEFIEQKKLPNDLTIDDLNVFISQILNNSLNKNFKGQIDPQHKLYLEPFINTSVKCFSQNLVDFYQKNNMYNIAEIIQDLKNNNIPYSFPRGICKSSVIAGLNYLQNKLGTSFKINDSIGYLTNNGALTSGFSQDSFVNDSNIISSTGNVEMYSFSPDQLNYLNNYIQNKQ